MYGILSSITPYHFLYWTILGLSSNMHHEVWHLDYYASNISTDIDMAQAEEKESAGK